MTQGRDWPIPAERRPLTARERIVQAAPAILVSVLLHGIAAWWLLRAVDPWDPRKQAQSTAAAIEVFYFDATPPPPPASPPVVVEMEVMRVYAVPFPMSQPNETVTEMAVREPKPARVVAQPQAVSAGRLLGDVNGIVSDMAGRAPGSVARSNTQLPGRDVPFSDADVQFKAAPLSPQKRTQAAIGLLMRTRGANTITDFMGITGGRDPGAELSRGHHDGLYLPRDCDDPDHPNVSDECMGIPKR